MFYRFSRATNYKPSPFYVKGCHNGYYIPVSLARSLSRASDPAKTKLSQAIRVLKIHCTVWYGYSQVTILAFLRSVK